MTNGLAIDGRAQLRHRWPAGFFCAAAVLVGCGAPAVRPASHADILARVSRQLTEHALPDDPRARLVAYRAVDAELATHCPRAWVNVPDETYRTVDRRAGLNCGFRRIAAPTKIMDLAQQGWAWTTGLLPGDEILRANGEPVEAEGPILLSYHLRTLVETQGPVRLNVRRRDTTGRRHVLELTSKGGFNEWDDLRLDRPRPPPLLQVRRFDSEGTLYVLLKGFGSEPPDALREATDRAWQAGCRGLILDLRNCGGGLLQSAVAHASLFSDAGSLFRYEPWPGACAEERREVLEDPHRIVTSATPGHFHGKFRIAVLVGPGTAGVAIFANREMLYIQEASA